MGERAGSLARCAQLGDVNTDRMAGEIQHVCLHGARVPRGDLVRDA